MQKGTNIENLIRYLRGKLPNKERHSIEREMNDDPFLSDAMDGYAKFSADSVKNDMVELEARLKGRVSETKTRSLKPFIQIAASIILLVGIATTVYILSDTDLPITEIAEQIHEEQETEAIDKTAVSEPRQPETESTASKQEKERVRAKSKTKVNQKEEPVRVVQEASKEEFKSATGNEMPALEDEEQIGSAIAQAPIQKKQIEAASASEAGLMELRSEESVEEGLLTISGKAVDMETFEPLPGVSIVVQGTTDGTLTDLEGNFSIETEPDDIIVMSYVGYLTEEISVDKLSKQEEPIALKQDLVEMDEVVVTGYGTQKKRSAKTVSEPAKIDMAAFEEGATQPEPIIGFKEFKAYIQEEKQVDENNSISIKLSFVVDANGEISDIKVLDTTIDRKYKKEAIRLLKEGPEWKPGIVSGLPQKLETSIVVRL